MDLAGHLGTVLLTCSVLACGESSAAPLGEEGFETGPCIQGACLGGLVCLSDLCVLAPQAPQTTGEPPSGSTSTGSDVAEETTAEDTTGGCPAPELTCNGVCIDVTVDPANCGGCASPVGEGRQCVDGEPACLAGLTECGDACVDLATSTQHCGACDAACPDSRFGIDPMPPVCEPFGMAGNLACTSVIAVDSFVSCEDVCTAAGWDCSDGVALYQSASSGCTNTNVVSCAAVPVDIHEDNGCLGEFSFVACNCFATPG